jgi:hypothetical protein
MLCLKIVPDVSKPGKGSALDSYRTVALNKSNVNIEGRVILIIVADGF